MNPYSTERWLFIVLKKWWVILFYLIVLIALAWVFTRYKESLYKVTAKVLINQNDKNTKYQTEAIDLGKVVAHNSSVDNELEILKTKELVANAVRNYSLNVKYYKKGKIKNLEIYPAPISVNLHQWKSDQKIVLDINLLSSNFQLISGKINQKFNYRDSIKFDNEGVVTIEPNLAYKGNKYEHIVVEITNPTETVEAIVKSLEATIPNKMTTTIDLTLQTNIREKGEFVLEKILETYISKNNSQQSQTVDSALAFINNRLDSVHKDLIDAENQLENFKQENHIADISEQSKQLVLNTNNYISKLTDIETQMNVLETIESLLKNDNNKKVIPSNIISNDPVFSKLLDNYNVLILEKDKLLLTSTEDNPYIKNLDERITTVRKGMLSNLMSTKNGLNITKNNLSKDLTKVEDLTKNIPKNERKVLDLNRYRETKQNLYLYLLQKKEEITLSKNSAGELAKIIDKPKAELKASSPKKIQYFAIAVFAALALGLLTILAFQVLKSKVNSRYDLVETANLPIIGEIPSQKNINFHKQLEWFQNYFIQHKTSGKTILLTSSEHETGLSFIADNLANSLSNTGYKTVLIQLNSNNKSNNLTEFWEASTFQLEQNFYSKNIFELHTSDNTAVSHKKFIELLSNLSQVADFIVIDASVWSEMGAIPLIANYSAFVVNILKPGKSKKANLKQFAAQFNSGKESVVFNEIKNIKNYKESFNGQL